MREETVFVVAKRSKAVLLALASIAVIVAVPAKAEMGRVAWVVDGDTFRLQSGERIRIAAIDAAETDPDKARCPAEVRTGRKATAEVITRLKGA